MFIIAFMILILTMNEMPLAALLPHDLTSFFMHDHHQKDLKHEHADDEKIIIEENFDTSPQDDKTWTLLIYMAANNNLHKYALKNLRQLLLSGSTASINIVVQLDEYGKTEAMRLFIEKNKVLIKQILTDQENAISGTPQSLQNFLEWGTQNYPSQHLGIIIWNHGSGIKDPSIWGKLYLESRDQFFEPDPETGLLAINRHLLRSTMNKGIAFNDTHQEYINNQQLYTILHSTVKNVRQGNKIDILFLDACHMAMVEFCTKFKNIAEYFVASEEIEPGSGYNYQRLLEPFQNGSSLSPRSFAIHAVEAYAQEYETKLADFTQSAISLHDFQKTEDTISQLATYLYNLIEEDKEYFTIIKKIRKSDTYTTELCDWDYIDFIHFLKSIIVYCGSVIEEASSTLDHAKLRTLQNYARECMASIKKHIIANETGIGLPHAYGLSIYFPNKKELHRSYEKTIFSKTTTWTEFLHLYLKYKNRSPSKSLLS